MADDLHYGAKELLSRALDRQAVAGRINIAAIPMVHKLLIADCKIEPGLGAFTIGGDLLDQACEKFLNVNSWLAPPPDPAAGAAEAARAALESQARLGNATAHGQLFKQLGKADYEKWAAANKSKPGAPPAEDGAAHDRNPWSIKGWSLRAQGETVRALGKDKAGEIASAVGCVIGSTRGTM